MGLVAVRAASSVSARAQASAAEGSRVPSRMKYQASASARMPGPSSAWPSRPSRGDVAALDVADVPGGRTDPTGLGRVAAVPQAASSQRNSTRRGNDLPDSSQYGDSSHPQCRMRAVQ
jgi:hypothetical protein